MFEQNQVSRIPFTKYGSIQKIRQEIVYEVAKLERFKHNMKII